MSSGYQEPSYKYYIYIFGVFLEKNWELVKEDSLYLVEKKEIGLIFGGDFQ